MKGIIFDMDNTLLRSNIDFFAMKQAIYQLLVREKMIPSSIPWQEYTPSQMIEMARGHEKIKVVENEIWSTVRDIEQRGMEGAVLEPGVEIVLQQLQRQGIILAILTNNAQAAATQVLRQTGIKAYFNIIAGREQMAVLKPSPSGIHYILRHFPNTQPEDWLVVGDSWIDGRAAEEAGIPFIAYCADKHKLDKNSVTPLASIDRITQLLDYV